MRKVVFIFSFCLIFILAYTQEDKVGQTKPLNKNSGRVLKLKEIMRITDEQGGFYFRYPYEMHIDSEGSIYIMDHNQLLRFNEKGKLLNNYYRKGQGPGELISIKNYILNKNHIIVYDYLLNKFIWFDKNGPCVKEYRLPIKFFSGILLLFKNNKYYFIKYSIPAARGITQQLYNLVELSYDGNIYKHLIRFTVKYYVEDINGNGRRGYKIVRFISKIYQKRYLIVSHTSEYLIKIYDFEKNCISKIFSRKYERVKFKKKPNLNQYKNTPKIRYENDIKDILTFKDKIWVVTSTENINKEILIDTFDFEGNYLDNFYLNLKGSILATHKNYVFVRERDKYDNAVIVKYMFTDR